MLVRKIIQLRGFSNEEIRIASNYPDDIPKVNIQIQLSTYNWFEKLGTYSFNLKGYLKGESPDSVEIKHLRLKIGRQFYEISYPKDWDLSGNYTDLATKHAIKWTCRKLGVVDCL